MDELSVIEKPIIGENHVEAASEIDAAPILKAYIDPARKVFVTSRGNEISLTGKIVSALMLERFAKLAKPKVPKKEVTLLGKIQQLEGNPNDPGYLALLKEWEEEQNITNMIYLFNVGVKGTPPPEFVEEQRPFFPDTDDKTMKYLWVASQLPDEDIAAFSEALMGQSMPTKKGLEEAANFTASR